MSDLYEKRKPNSPHATRRAMEALYDLTENHSALIETAIRNGDIEQSLDAIMTSYRNCSDAWFRVSGLLIPQDVVEVINSRPRMPIFLKYGKVKVPSSLLASKDESEGE